MIAVKTSSGVALQEPAGYRTLSLSDERLIVFHLDPKYPEAPGEQDRGATVRPRLFTCLFQTRKT